MSVLGIHPGSSGLTVRDERRLFAVLMTRDEILCAANALETAGLESPVPMRAVAALREVLARPAKE